MNILEKLSCASGIIVMAGDLNVDWLKKDGHERQQLFTIFETFGFVQNIEVAKSKHLHLLDTLLLGRRVTSLSALHATPPRP